MARSGQGHHAAGGSDRQVATPAPRSGPGPSAAGQSQRLTPPPARSPQFPKLASAPGLARATSQLRRFVQRHEPVGKPRPPASARARRPPLLQAAASRPGTSTDGRPGIPARAIIMAGRPLSQVATQPRPAAPAGIDEAAEHNGGIVSVGQRIKHAHRSPGCDRHRDPTRTRQTEPSSTPATPTAAARTNSLISQCPV